MLAGTTFMKFAIGALGFTAFWGGFWAGVGTILFNMAVNPANGKIYVSNTDANNFDRFEGPGTFTGHSLRGHLQAYARDHGVVLPMSVYQPF